MGRKLKGRLVTAKGLKGALARHEELSKIKQQREKTLLAQKENKANKDKSIKSGGNTKKVKQNQLRQSAAKGLVPFTPEESVLLVGEGDFTFALSIVKQNLVRPESLVATSFDSKEELVAKYPDVETTLAALEKEGVIVRHDIDATNLPATLKTLPTKKKPHVKLFNTNKKLDCIMFNFPHTGRGMKDMDRNVRDHQKLVAAYFRSCKEVFKIMNSTANNDFGGYNSDRKMGSADSKIVLSIFEGEPYNSWKIKMLARSEGYKVERSGKFDWLMFPEYHHKRTNGIRDTTKPAHERDARIYIFDPYVKAEDRPKKTEESDSDSD